MDGPIHRHPALMRLTLGLRWLCLPLVLSSPIPLDDRKGYGGGGGAQFCSSEVAAAARLCVAYSSSSLPMAARQTWWQRLRWLRWRRQLQAVEEIWQQHHSNYKLRSSTSCTTDSIVAYIMPKQSTSKFVLCSCSVLNLIFVRLSYACTRVNCWL